MFLSGRRVYNHSHKNEDKMYNVLPETFPVADNLLKVIFSWSQVGIVQKDSGWLNFERYEFHIGRSDKIERIVDATFSWDRLFVVDERKQCVSFSIGKDEDQLECKTGGFQRIESGDSHVIGLKENGKCVSLLCSEGEIIPKEIHIDLRVTAVACGKEHSLFLTTNGSVYSMGAGSRAQLGHGEINIEPMQTPCLIESLEGVIIKHISAGGWHSISLSDEGDMYIWGWNESGQLGFPAKCLEHDADTDEVTFLTTPTILDIDEDTIRNVGCGSRHSSALTEKGVVYTWGWNNYGQLGHGDTQTRDSPTPVEYFQKNNITVKDIHCGGWNTAFIIGATEVT